jgi:hypothetical protein
MKQKIYYKKIIVMIREGVVLPTAIVWQFPKSQTSSLARITMDLGHLKNKPSHLAVAIRRRILSLQQQALWL